MSTKKNTIHHGWKTQIPYEAKLDTPTMPYGSNHCLRRYKPPPSHPPVPLPKKVLGSIGMGWLSSQKLKESA